MSEQTLFEKLNAPFPYDQYRYDKFNENVYVSGQAMAERLNKCLGVGYWRYEGLYNTETMIEEGNFQRVKIYVKFSFYNHDLKEWIEFTDCGSEKIKKGMNNGDATKSAITDGMKKCASRLGVASDLYNGLITYDKQRGKVIIPSHYKEYYIKMGWIKEKQQQEQQPQQQEQKQNIDKNLLEEYQNLYGSLDGYEKFVEHYLKQGNNKQQILDGLLLGIQKKKQKQEAGQGV